MGEISLSDLAPRKETKDYKSGGAILMQDINRAKKQDFSSRTPEIVKNNHRITEVLKDGQWAGERIAVVGGGASLKGFDFGKLDGFKTIAINRGFEHFEPDVIFCTDGRMWPWIEKGELGEEAKRRFHETKAVKVWSDIGGYPLPEDIYIAKAIGRPGMSTTINEGIGYATNSGFGALNLALLLAGKGSEIYLFGYDMQGPRWYGEYPGDPEVNTKEDFVNPFNDHKDQILGFGTQIFNVNKESRLDVFPKISFDELFKKRRTRKKG